MSRPFVLAHHLIFTAYGWWLPNDPRGSMSRTIRSDVVAELGSLHHGRKTLQPAHADLDAFYRHAQDRLEHDLLEFSPPDVVAVAESFASLIRSRRYTCYACAVMPDHVHLLIRKHRDLAEEMIVQFQRASRLRLRDLRLRRAEHPVWGGPGWKVFLDHPDDIRRTIDYIDSNPVKMGRPRQSFSFVTPYDNWPLHPGHNPSSPYAKRLRGR